MRREGGKFTEAMGKKHFTNASIKNPPWWMVKIGFHGLSGKDDGVTGSDAPLLSRKTVDEMKRRKILESEDKTRCREGNPYRSVFADIPVCEANRRFDDYYATLKTTQRGKQHKDERKNGRYAARTHVKAKTRADRRASASDKDEWATRTKETEEEDEPSPAGVQPEFSANYYHRHALHACWSGCSQRYRGVLNQHKRESRRKERRARKHATNEELSL